MDCFRSLRNLPFRKMQSGASALIRQSGGILDIATATCSRSSCAVGLVNQHRVFSLMKGFVGQPTRGKLVWWWARYVLRVMVCARLPDSTLFQKKQDAFWVATRGSIAFGITIDVPHSLNPYVPSFLALASASHLRLSSMGYSSKLPSAATGFASLLLRSSMRLSFITCKDPIVALVSISRSLCMEEFK